jgi:hypothetical protein
VIPWNYLIIDGCKPHTVPLHLEGALVDDLFSREELKGSEPLEFTSKPVTKVSIDMPGMVAIDRPWMPFQLDGLVIEMPCEDVASFLSKLIALKPRYFKSPYAPGEKIPTGVTWTEDGKTYPGYLDKDGKVQKGELLATGNEPGQMYYKLHGFTMCIVLTPDQHMLLIDALRAGLQEAEAQATAFWAGRKLPSQVLREAAAVTSGKPIEEIPNLGANKQDRFHAQLPKKGDA